VRGEGLDGSRTRGGALHRRVLRALAHVGLPPVALLVAPARVPLRPVHAADLGMLLVPLLLPIHLLHVRRMRGVVARRFARAHARGFPCPESESAAPSFHPRFASALGAGTSGGKGSCGFCPPSSAACRCCASRCLSPSVDWSWTWPCVVCG